MSGPLRIVRRLWDRLVDLFVSLWDRLVEPFGRIPAVRRFDAWANAKERAWRARRNAPLVAQLRAAGLHDAADQLRGTRCPY